MVTDDYDEWSTKYKAYTPNSFAGLTISLRDRNAKAMSATRAGDIIVVQYAFFLSGTYTGTTGWFPLFGVGSHDTTFQDLIDINTETITDGSLPYFSINGVGVDGGAVPDGVMQGRYIWVTNGTYNCYFSWIGNNSSI